MSNLERPLYLLTPILARDANGDRRIHGNPVAAGVVVKATPSVILRGTASPVSEAILTTAKGKIARGSGAQPLAEAVFTTAFPNRSWNSATPLVEYVVIDESVTDNRGADGTIVDGIFYVYDNARGKSLSTDRPAYHFAEDRKKIKGNQYLRIMGDAPTNASSYNIIRSATIVGVSVRLNSAATGTFRIQVTRGGSIITMVDVNITAQEYYTDKTLNVDLLANDMLSVLCVPVTDVDYPVVTVETAWRI